MKIYNHGVRIDLEYIERVLSLAGISLDFDIEERAPVDIVFDPPIKKVSDKTGKLLTYYRPNKIWFDVSFPKDGHDVVCAWFTSKQYSLGGKNDGGGVELEKGRLSISGTGKTGARRFCHEYAHHIENYYSKYVGKFVHKIDYTEGIEALYRYIGELRRTYGDYNPHVNYFKYLAIHHTASVRGSNQLYAVDKYHREERGYPRGTLGFNVGYNYFLDVDGKITQTRMEGEETMAQKKHNCDVPERCDTISICLAGNFDIELPNDAQIKSLRKFIEGRNLEVVFHRDLQVNRTCPGRLFTKTYLDRILGKLEPTESVSLETLSELKTALLWLQRNMHRLFP
jgi:hypothetical protein